MTALARGFSRPLALLMAGAMFMELLDATVLVTAAPRIAPDLGVPTASMALPISIYLVAAGAFIPASGWAVDRFGGRRSFVAAVALFTAASAVCTASPTLAVLTTARAAQGIGGALMVPVGRLVVLRGIGREDVLRAVAFLTWPALAAPLLGPVVGGVLATDASWRWIFVINIPLGILAIAFARLVPPTRGPQRPLDVRGLALTVGCLASAMAATAVLSRPNPHPAVAGTLLLAAAATGITGVRHLRDAPSPLLTFHALTVPTFRVSHAGGSVFRTVVNAVPFLLPVLFVDGFGWTPARAGMFLAALFVGNLAIKPLTTPMLRTAGFRTTLLAAILGSATSIALCATLRPETPALLTVALLAASGAFRSIGFTAYNTLAYAELPAEQLTDANTLSSTAQQLALGFGAAIGAIALHIAVVLAPGHDRQLAFLLVAAPLLAPAIEILRLPRDAGRHLTNATP